MNTRKNFPYLHVLTPLYFLPTEQAAGKIRWTLESEVKAIKYSSIKAFKLRANFISVIKTLFVKQYNIYRNTLRKIMLTLSSLLN